jgi:hypothetical protein
MNQGAQTKMTTNELPSPLELAHLSIALVQAGMLPAINLAHMPTITGPLGGANWKAGLLALESLEKEKQNGLRLAMQYFETCSRMVKQERDAERERLSESEERKPVLTAFYQYLKKYAVEDRISVERLVRYCNCQRVKLSPSDQLSKAEQMSAIFLLLTNRQTPETRKFMGRVTPIEHRRRWAHKGVPSLLEAPMQVEVMLHVKRRRQSEKGIEGFKRRKPRAPKGDDGKYRSKELPPKNESGRFKKTRK